ncbi:methionyl-tRNA formyltransferase [Leucobacter aridicollis]|uniref:methionyl-tRNA formyltransferase n=1 Tax=Leucobacter aridicollis TaxID=283878 RepID=UPI002168FA32|nr:methionyl-tRNA formyltransferase [Leucobacter aridicollis]MCS3428560.1 methionyl-tRNA formyltransferase [Leucobacter aridicollis]
MRIVFAGTPEFAVPSLRALVDAGHDVVGVVTREDAPLGRKRVLTPSPVAQAASDLGIDTLKANRLGDEATAWVQDRAPELGVIVAYGGLIREPLLSSPAHGWINLHFSDLPRWRGAAPVQRALMAGEQELGVTVFRLVAALDAGDVLTRDSTTFAPGTSAGEALTALSASGTDALLRAVALLAEDPEAGEAQLGEDTYAHKLSREDGLIAFGSGASAEAVLAHWAGVTPEPGAYALIGGDPIKLTELRPLDAGLAAAVPADLAPGEVRLVAKRAVVGCGTGTAAGSAAGLELARVQPAGKPAMDGAAWLRGRDGKADLA